MREITFLTLLLFTCQTLIAQGDLKATDIIAKRDGENIIVSYRLPGSKTDESFFITIAASIDGGPKTNISFVTGDVGANISGGKMQYNIVWEALKDVNQIGAVEFYISAEKRYSSLPKKSKQTKVGNAIRNRKWLIAADFMYDKVLEPYRDPSLYPGIKIAYYKKWGGYLTFNPYSIMAGPVYSFNYPAVTEISTFIGAGSFYNGDSAYLEDAEVLIEGGAAISYKWFYFSFSMIFDFYQGHKYPNIATGVRF